MRYYNAKEAAEVLGIGRSTAYRRFKDRGITRISEADLPNLMQKPQKDIRKDFSSYDWEKGVWELAGKLAGEIVRLRAEGYGEAVEEEQYGYASGTPAEGA